MRLLLLTPQYPPTFGGAELQTQRLARVLDSRGVRVTILTQSVRGVESSEHDGGIYIVRGLAGLRLGPLWGLTYMLSSRRWLRRLASEWDIVQNQQVGLHSWVSVRVARHLGRPSVLRFACSGQGGDLAAMRMRRFGPLLVGGLRDADGFVALTSEGASEITRYALPATKVVTIPNGVDLSGFSLLSWPNLQGSDPIRLLFVGRLVHQKGLDVLLSALAMLKDRLAFTLRVVGVGDELDRLREQTHLAGLDGKVEFRGRLTSVVEEYAWCEVLVLPSRFEGMPNVVLEALSCGRPVLGTRVGGTAELVESGVNGWLVPVEDEGALAECIARISMRRENLRVSGIEGRRIVEQRYSLEASASRYVELYERLLATRR
jgi:L-malate glycosyltransferase